MKVEAVQGGIRPEWLVRCQGPLGGDMAMLLDSKEAAAMAARLCDTAYRLLVNNEHAKQDATVRGELDCLELLARQWPALDDEEDAEDVEEATA